MARPSLLILSFSPLRSDARVLKQINLFTSRYDVTTCGYGEAPDGVADHVRIPDDRVAKYDGRPLRLRAYRWAYWHHPVVAWARETLPVGAFDAILADDVDTAGLALDLAPRRGVHVDLHEYAPRMNEHLPAWDRWVRPFMEWMVRRHVRRAASVTTVGRHLAQEYQRQFGLRDVGVVINATPYHDLSPTPIGDPIRLVHSGVARPARRLEDTIAAVEAAGDRFTLDLFLAQNTGPYYESLRERVARTDNIVLHDPVPYARLVETLNDYDVGVFSLPPTTFNYEWALPNKLFDFVQARLALAISPSPEMSEVVHGHGVGAVADAFGPQSLGDLLESLDAESVRRMKQASHAAAGELAAENQMDGWTRPIAALLGE